MDEHSLTVGGGAWRGAGFVDSVHALYTGDPSGPALAVPRLAGTRREAFRKSPCWPSRDLAVLWDLLSNLYAAAGCDPEPRDRWTVLDLACGRCSEAVLLGARAAQWVHALAPGSIELFGVDIRDRELARARNRCDATRAFFQPFSPQHSPAFEPCFLYGDATDLSGLAQIPGAVDLVFLRHQNGWHNARIWTEIFGQGLARLAPGSHLVITSYFDREHAMALNMISGLGGRLEASLRNPFSRELKTPGKSVDRHAALFTRP